MSGLKEIERLLKNIKILNEANALEAEFESIDETLGKVETIEELNDYLEESMTYWEY